MLDGLADECTECHRAFVQTDDGPYCRLYECLVQAKRDATVPGVVTLRAELSVPSKKGLMECIWSTDSGFDWQAGTDQNTHRNRSEFQVFVDRIPPGEHAFSVQRRGTRHR